MFNLKEKLRSRITDKIDDADTSNFKDEERAQELLDEAKDYLEEGEHSKVFETVQELEELERVDEDDRD